MMSYHFLNPTRVLFGACTSEHAMEHAMSAYHQTLPHGAGLTME